MPTNYPTQKDVWFEKIASQAIYASDFVDLQDAVNALEVKVGRNLTATDSTIDYWVNNLIASPSSNYIYFYENSAPTGWTATLTAGDRVLGVVASAGDYNVAGGNIAGSWYLATAMQTDTHLHCWLYTSANINYSYTSGGTLAQYPFAQQGGTGYKSYNMFGVRYHTEDASDFYDTRGYRWGASGYTNNDTHSHDFTPGWRPATAVGIICRYSG